MTLMSPAFTWMICMCYRRPKIRIHEGGVTSKASDVDVRELESTELK